MKRTIALLLLLFPLFAISQNTYQQGYFIENGVKKECLVKNMAWKNNPESIEYKLSEADLPKIKTIKQISEFSVDNAYTYKKYIVDIDLSSSTLDHLSTKKEPEWQKDTLLLKLLIDGKAALYQYERGNMVKYFFSAGDHSKAEQLVYKEYSTSGMVGENNAYRQQLFNLMKDANIEQAKFEKIKYKKDALTALFVDYNRASGQESKNMTEKQNKGSINLKITPGLNFSSLSVDNSVSNVNFEFGSKTTFRLGAELEYILPFNNNKWSLFLDPNYQSYNNEGQEKNKKGKVEYKYFELPIGVRHYMYLNAKSKIFIDAAYVLAFNMDSSYIQYNGQELEIDRNSNLALGIGYSFGRYSAEARYSLNHNIINYASWGTDYNSLSIILGYRIF